jgi:endonuclease/exonuclease/phosphatase family metal-dependent hydrolase
MRIVAWNLGHQTKERPIRGGFQKIIARLEPDILTLNEYVHGPSRDVLLSSLSETGLSHALVSTPSGLNNQVLIASRFRIVAGTLQSPSVSVAANTNFLHVCLPNENLEVVGMRVPAYRQAHDKDAYWQEFSQIAATTRDRRIIFIGDFNVDPTRRYVGARQLNQLVQAGWQLPSPEGSWSFVSKTDKTSRIDHALVSPGLIVEAARYVAEIDSMKLAGSDDTACSDHAALVVDIQI